jgi:hypothetical protein
VATFRRPVGAKHRASDANSDAFPCALCASVVNSSSSRPVASFRWCPRRLARQCSAHSARLSSHPPQSTTTTTTAVTRVPDPASVVFTCCSCGGGYGRDGSTPPHRRPPPRPRGSRVRTDDRGAAYYPLWRTQRRHVKAERNRNRLPTPGRAPPSCPALRVSRCSPSIRLIGPIGPIARRRFTLRPLFQRKTKEGCAPKPSVWRIILPSIPTKNRPIPEPGATVTFVLTFCDTTKFPLESASQIPMIVRPTTGGSPGASSVGQLRSWGAHTCHRRPLARAGAARS